MKYYKRNEDGTILTGNKIHGNGWVLDGSDPTITHDGWRWFETDEEAYRWFAADPLKVHRRQLFLALLQREVPITRRDILLQLEGNEPALVEFEEAIYFERNHQLVNSLAAIFNLSKEEVDNIFAVAATL